MYKTTDLKKCLENSQNAGDISRNESGFVKAAVMVIFFSKKKNKIIMIKRKNNLRKHSGQIAFPGGRFEESDKDLLDTAVRETNEEIGLSKNKLNVIGSLPFFFTGTGYMVKPFLSTLKDDVIDLNLKPDPVEVDKIYLPDANKLLNPINQKRILAPLESKMKKTWRVQFKYGNIWGLTARILVTISAGLNLRDYPPCDDI